MDLLALLALPLLLIGGLLLDGSSNDDDETATSEPPPTPEPPPESDTIEGTENADAIRGTNDDDIIFGLGGNDSVSGLDGVDQISGGAGNDSLQGDGGADTLRGGRGDDELFGAFGNDSVFGGSGNDALFGEVGYDTLIGDAGADTLIGGRGNDALYGGAGRDTLDGGTGDDVLNGGNNADVLFAGTGADSLYGGGGNDILTARPQNPGDPDDPRGDLLDGGRGDDTLRGEASFVLGGADTLTGGAGDDAFRINATGGAAGQTIVDPTVITDFTRDDSLEIRLDRLTSNPDLQLVPTEDGTGTLVQIGGVTHVVLQGVTDADASQINLISDNVLGQRLTGTEGADQIFATGTADYLIGRGGDDLLSANVDSSAGVTMEGGEGNDRLDGGLFGDLMYGGTGNDSLTGSGIDDEYAPDTLFGGFGDDTLVGADGDVMTGGAGNDEFHVDAFLGAATITDFTPGVDIIDLSDFGFTDSSAVQELSLRSVAGGTQLLYGDDVVAVMQGVQPAAINLARDVRLSFPIVA